MSFPVDPAVLGLPSRDELVDLRIWSLHYHGIDRHREMQKYISRMGIERVFSVDVGGSVGDDLQDPEMADRHRQLLDEYRDSLAGIVRIDPGRPEESLDRINRWIAHGPCVGIKYAGGNPSGLTCSHPNNDRFISRASELGAIIYIHASYEVSLEEPRYPGSGVEHGESTPDDVVELASRFPDTPLICGHAGAIWEWGIRAIRPYENIYLEFSGMPPQSGATRMAVDVLGADRIVWGGHLPSRGYANGLAKVYDGNFSDEVNAKILGRNLRRLAAPIMNEKGYDVTV